MLKQTKTPEQFAEAFVENDAGPAVYQAYLTECRKKGVKPTSYLQIMLLLLKSLSALS